MKRIVISAAIVALSVIAISSVTRDGAVNPAVAQTRPATREIPRFEPDPSWPKLPAKWVFGQVSSVSIDERGHAWILQRPTTIRSDQKARAMAAPPVIEFDEAGNYVQGWGGPGEGYDWVESEHGIYVDRKVSCGSAATARPIIICSSSPRKASS